MSLVEILLIFVGISILMVVHETGHYLAARAFGMKVVRYSIGFGPTIFKHKPKGSPTTFQIAIIPFLAYVQIAGMNPYEEVEENEEGLFNDASLFGRVVTVAAGPFANYLAAFLIALGVGLVGWPPYYLQQINPDDPRFVVPAEVGQVVEDSPAERATLMAGDEIIEMDGVAIESFRELVVQTRQRPGQTVNIVVRRDGAEVPLTITPADNDGQGSIGVIRAETEMGPIQLGVGEAATVAMVLPWKLTLLQLGAVKNMVTERDTSSLGGPVAIGEAFGRAAREGPIHWILQLMMMSIALGFFNLLPLPALDGGRLLFLGYEAITTRKPNPKFEAVIHGVGILFLLVLIGLVTVRDIGRWGDSAPESTPENTPATEPEGSEADGAQEANPETGAENAEEAPEGQTDEAPESQTGQPAESAAAAENSDTE